MWARVSTYEGPPENIDEDVRYADEAILPQVRQLAGFGGLYALADRQTGRTMSITWWDSEDDMRASETDADRLRQDRRSTLRARSSAWSGSTSPTRR